MTVLGTTGVCFTKPPTVGFEHASSKINLYDSGSFVSRYVYVYSGADWIKKRLKIYKG